MRRHPFVDVPERPLRSADGVGTVRLGLRLLRGAVRFLFPGGGRRLSSRGAVVMCSLLIGLVSLLASLRGAATTASSLTDRRALKLNKPASREHRPARLAAGEESRRLVESSLFDKAGRGDQSINPTTSEPPQETLAQRAGGEPREPRGVFHAIWHEPAATESHDAPLWPRGIRAGSADSPDRDDSEVPAPFPEFPPASRALRSVALPLLAAARRDLAAGHLVEAWHKAREAAELNVSYQVFDDRPELVFAEIERTLAECEERVALARGARSHHTAEQEAASESGVGLLTPQGARAVHRGARSTAPLIVPGPVAAPSPQNLR